ncbi:MAG TPA: response regulator [Candidatus Thermoplasmatota archaeon]|nr:response regulator [Candidatus Thermoplasmatota archaeon]
MTSQAQAPLRAMTAPPLHTPRVLVVDDEEDILLALRSFLRRALPGVDIVTASSGRLGLERLAAGDIDIILSDYRMPEMDGLRFLELAGLMAPSVPRMMFTAYPDMQLSMRAVNEARIIHFFTKPVDPQQVRDVLAVVLDAQRAMRARELALQRSVDLMRARAGAPPAA